MNAWRGVAKTNAASLALVALTEMLPVSKGCIPVHGSHLIRDRPSLEAVSSIFKACPCAWHENLKARRRRVQGIAASIAAMWIFVLRRRLPIMQNRASHPHFQLPLVIDRSPAPGYG